jgi:2-polyprenyl-3-methyl-5-hydroxy-6-metoxy-1,4-benzoquinol methylase
VADQIAGSILDSGCGTGENAFFFASRGHKVIGIDFLTNLTEREQTVLESNVSPMWAYDRSCDMRE